MIDIIDIGISRISLEGFKISNMELEYSLLGETYDINP